MALFAVSLKEWLLQYAGVYEEFEELKGDLKAFLLVQHNEDGTHIVDDPTSDVASSDAPYVTIGNTAALSAERALVGTSNEIDVTDNGAGTTVAVGLVAEPNAATALTIGGTAGSTTSTRALTKKVTGIADNTPTTLMTVTVPNGNHAATLRLLFLSSNGSTDAFESSRAAQGLIVFQRNTGVVAVATAATLADPVIATNGTGGSATHTLAYSVSAASGAAGAVNTFTVAVTIDDSGNVGSNQVVVFAELLNAEATGVTVA
jgi:hypothetical protein